MIEKYLGRDEIKELYSIGEVSKIKQITIKALRYYHKMGILIPRYVDEETGYRYYSIEQFIHIDIIKGGRALGTSIAELQEIFKDPKTEKLIAFLQLKRTEALETISKMQEVIHDIDRLSQSVADGQQLLQEDEIMIKYYDERHILVAPCQESGSLKELLYYSKLDKLISMQENKMTLNRGMIYKLDSQHKIKPMYVFNEIDQSEPIVLHEQMMTLPKGHYLTLAYSTHNELKRVEKIESYLKRHPVNIQFVIEMELFNDLFNTDSYSCQTQIYLGEHSGVNYN